MKTTTNKITSGILVFTTGILLFALTLIFPDVRILKWLMIIISIIYLTAGWFLFKSYYPEGHPLLLFFIGYLYSSVFMAIAFVVIDLPLAKEFLSIGPLWAVCQIIMVIVFRKKIPKEGFIQFIIEGVILLLLTIFLLARICYR